MSNIYCVVVLALFVFVLCALCWWFLWFVHFWLLILYSLAFISNWQYMIALKKTFMALWTISSKQCFKSRQLLTFYLNIEYKQIFFNSSFLNLPVISTTFLFGFWQNVSMLPKLGNLTRKHVSHLCKGIDITIMIFQENSTVTLHLTAICVGTMPRLVQEHSEIVPSLCPTSSANNQASN